MSFRAAAQQKLDSGCSWRELNSRQGERNVLEWESLECRRRSVYAFFLSRSGIEQIPPLSFPPPTWQHFNMPFHVNTELVTERRSCLNNAPSALFIKGSLCECECLPPKCVQSADLLGKGNLQREKQTNKPKRKKKKILVE